MEDGPLITGDQLPSVDVVGCANHPVVTSRSMLSCVGLAQGVDDKQSHKMNLRRKVSFEEERSKPRLIRITLPSNVNEEMASKLCTNIRMSEFGLTKEAVGNAFYC